MHHNINRFGVALLTFIIGASLANLWPDKPPVHKLKQGKNISVPACSVASADSKYARLIIGTWEGRETAVSRLYGREYTVTYRMYLTFKADGTAIIDYSPGGGEKFEVAYRFKDERTIIDNVHPENLIINEGKDGAISFSPEGNRTRKWIEMIYQYKFRKIK